MWLVLIGHYRNVRGLGKSMVVFRLFEKLRYCLSGSCVLKASVDRVSVDTIDRYGDRHSADISTDTRPIYRPTLGRYIDRHPADMSAECRSSVGRHVVLVHRPSVDTRPICCDRQSPVYRSTVGEVSVDC